MSEICIDHTEFAQSKNGILKIIAHFPSGIREFYDYDAYIVEEVDGQVYIGGLNKKPLQGDMNGKIFTLEQQLKMIMKFGVTVPIKVWKIAKNVH